MLRGDVIAGRTWPAAVAVLRCSITLGITQVKAKRGGSGAGCGSFPNPDSDAPVSRDRGWHDWSRDEGLANSASRAEVMRCEKATSQEENDVGKQESTCGEDNSLATASWRSADAHSIRHASRPDSAIRHRAMRVHASIWRLIN